jgi:type IV secretory pathway protease TraF
MVFGDTADSIDSRTFGCVKAGSILNRLRPLATERDRT